MHLYSCTSLSQTQVQLTNHMTDFHKIWRERYATGRHAHTIITHAHPLQWQWHYHHPHTLRTTKALRGVTYSSTL